MLNYWFVIITILILTYWALYGPVCHFMFKFQLFVRPEHFPLYYIYFAELIFLYSYVLFYRKIIILNDYLLD